MTISPARTAAFDVLLRIERDAALSSVLLPQFEANLNSKDRSLCHELVLGTLRRKLYLDRLIEELSRGRKIDLEVNITLRLGLYQLIYLDRIPAHSAINESVELVARAKKSSAKGFVNAILRSFQRKHPALIFASDVEQISIEESHPRWLVERWIDQFGFENTHAICKTHNKTPDRAFRVVSETETVLSLVKENNEITKSQFVPNCYLATALTRKMLDLAADGSIYFQDEGSQLVARPVIGVAGRRLLDLCAAPGGKTTMIANGTEAKVIAADIHFARARRLQDTIALQKVVVPVVQLDAADELPFEPRSFDTVFVDAPCSGTGTIRHNPELRYSIQESDVVRLSDKQLRILANASELVASGGTLIYATCSLETEENESVANKFLASNDSFTKESPGVPERIRTAGGYARTLPQRDGMDGFFIAVFRRN
jgi:16S rRNA (cytosine967-C5)-methyltransferase